MNIPIWTGTSTFAVGQTPFGFYDNDLDFQTDSDKVADFCARRLGYPLADVELQSGSFYTAFEEAITIYGNELYAYKIRENYLSLEGASSTTIPNGQLISPNLASIVRISEQYGVEAGVGGNVTWYSGSLSLIGGQQTYNMDAWAQANANLAANDSIEIKRIFYEAPPAITRYFDPYAGTGTGMIDLMDSFGWGSYSPAINFLMMPINYDNPYSNGTDLITNVAEVPFENPNYNIINSIGRQWIFEMTLAIAKEMLGYVRGKYSTIPIPDADVTLNQSDLLASATADRAALIERLRAYFDETSRSSLLERKATENDFLQQELNKVPYTIYIG